ncbi:relaxase/mobilization nuclease domain-containing protein [Christensenellaceae bacterium OttesenSCG-928-K19]|nr:relaxase/mobilization nuclease domain-containing protein [Christensenellaceae bacterium OttesenSCG-928-K19]
MAIIKAVNSKASMATALKYISQEKKTEEYLIGAYNCNPKTALEEMCETKAAWGKLGGRQYKHFIQSFPRVEAITPQEANVIAGELIQRCPLFQGYEVCYATHIDRGHVHTHILVNSVSFEHGRKLHQSKPELQAMKDLSDEILREHGKSICEKGDKITSYRMGAYRSIEKVVQKKYKSWMYEIMVAVHGAMKKATSRDDFTTRLSAQGITVDWRESRKYIVFVDKDGHKVRDKTLSKIFKAKISKEDLLNEFDVRRDDGKKRKIEDRPTRQDARRSRRVGQIVTDGSVDELRQHYLQISGIGASDSERKQERESDVSAEDRKQSMRNEGQQQHTGVCDGRQGKRVDRKSERSR